MSWQTGLGLSEEDRKVRNHEMAILSERRQERTCEKWKKELLHNSKSIIFPYPRVLIQCTMAQFDMLSGASRRFRSRCRIHDAATTVVKL
jgi:hypothetical protein